MKRSKPSSRLTKPSNNWRREVKLFLVFLAIWIALFIFAYRDLFHLGQFAFSEQDALPKDAAGLYYRLFIHFWNPYGYGRSIPAGLESFYAVEGWSLAAGLGASFPYQASHFFMALIFSMFRDNPTLAQHAFYYPLMSLSGITMYIFLGRFRLSFISRCIASFVYAVNVITIMAFWGGGPEKLPYYASQPMVLLFLFNLLERKGNWTRNFFMLALFSGLAASFSYPLWWVALVAVPTIAYIIIEWKKKFTLIAATLLLTLFAITFILILPYSFFILSELLSRPIVEVFSSISAKYTLESTLGGMRSVYSTSTPINLLRVLYLTQVPSWWYGGSANWNLLGFALPILAFSSLLFIKRNMRSRSIIVFSVMAILPVAFNWMTQQGYTYSLFVNFPILLVFNAPEYTMWLTMVAYAPLIAITIDELKDHIIPPTLGPPLKKISPDLYVINIRQFKRVIAFYLILLLAVGSIGGYSWPFFTGDLAMSMLSEGGVQIPKEDYGVQPVFYEMRDWLIKHDPDVQDFRVLVLPFSYQTHYSTAVLEANVIPPPTEIIDALVNRRTDRLGSLCGFFGVKYIFVNLIDFDVAATGTGWIKSDFVDKLNNQKDLNLVENNTNFLVYKNENFVPLVSVYDKMFNLVSLDGLRPPPAKILVLAVMPGFNMTRQLLFFGDTLPASDAQWVVSQTSTMIFFGDNASVYDQYISQAGSELSNVVHVFKMGERPLNVSVAGFDGETGYIEIPEGPPLNTTFTEMTISAWIYPFPYSGAKAIYSNPTPAYGGGFRWQLDDRWYTPVGPVPPLDGTIPRPPLNKWTLATAVFNGTHLLNYFDTTPTNSAGAGASSFKMSGTSYIGAYLGQAHFFKGFITNLQIYNKALNLTQIEQLFDTGLTATPLPLPDAGLVGWWPLNQSSGTIAYDLSGNGNYGTLRGDVSWVVVPEAIVNNPAASLGCAGKVFREETVNFYAPQNRSYSVALRVASAGSIGFVLTIDETSAISLPITHQDNNFHWYETLVPLSRGFHRIDVSTHGGPVFLDQVVIFHSIPQQNLTLEEIFNSPSQVSYTSREISWTEYSLDITSTRPSFVVLWQAFHPSWSAHSDGTKLYHFNASLWANGFYLKETGSRHVKIHFSGQDARNVVLLSWAIAWISLIGGIIYTSRSDIVSCGKAISNKMKDFQLSKRRLTR